MKDSLVKKYKEIVTHLGEYSSDTRLKVGCLVLKDERIVSTGYNGQLPGQPHKPIIVDGHDISTVHAEMNALIFCAKSGISTDGCDVFVTHHPCPICCKLLIMAGIDKVYYIHPYRNEENPFVDLIDSVRVD